MAELVQTVQSHIPNKPSKLVRAAQVAQTAEVRRSPNGVHFATFGETGVAGVDLDRMLEAVPTAITAALDANTYYFVPLAMREAGQPLESKTAKPEPAMVADAYADDLSSEAICHRNVELPHGKRGVFISTGLMGDRFALSFEFFINVAHAFVEKAGIPESFSELVWQQAVADTRGETSLDAWESRNLAFGRPANWQPETQPNSRRSVRPGRSLQRAFTTTLPSVSAQAVDEKERGMYLESAFSDAVAIYLLSLALDFDYSELREREYPLLAPSALAARLKLVAELFPPNPAYEFSVKYRRRA
jgi:hypothetical protein